MILWRHYDVCMLRRNKHFIPRWLATESNTTRPYVDSNCMGQLEFPLNAPSDNTLAQSIKIASKR